MKFRWVLLGPDDGPDGPPQVCHGAAPGPAAPSGAPRYALRGTDMVRREQLQNGRWKCTAVANFTARIVSDIIRDDGAEERRDFGLEAELGDKGWPSQCPRRSSPGWAGCCRNWDRRRSSIRVSNSMRVPPSSAYPTRSVRNAS